MNVLREVNRDLNNNSFRLIPLIRRYFDLKTAFAVLMDSHHKEVVVRDQNGRDNRFANKGYQNGSEAETTISQSGKTKKRLKNDKKEDEELRAQKRKRADDKCKDGYGEKERKRKSESRKRDEERRRKDRERRGVGNSDSHRSRVSTLAREKPDQRPQTCGSKTTRKRASRRQRQREKAAAFLNRNHNNNEPWNDYDPAASPNNNGWPDCDQQRHQTWLPLRGGHVEFDQPQSQQPSNATGNNGLDVTNIVHNLDQTLPSWTTLALSLGLVSDLNPAPIPNQQPHIDSQVRSQVSNSQQQRYADLERRRREAWPVLPSAAMFTNCQTVLGSMTVDSELRSRRVLLPSPQPPPPPPPQTCPSIATVVATQPEPLIPVEEANMEAPPILPPTARAIQKWEEPTETLLSAWRELTTGEPREVPPRPPAESREEPLWPAEKPFDADPNKIPLIEPELFEPKDPRPPPPAVQVDCATFEPLRLPRPRFAKKLKKGWENGPFEWGAIEPTVWLEDLIKQNSQNTTATTKGHKPNSQNPLASDVNSDIIQKVLSSDVVKQTLDSPHMRQALDAAKVTTQSFFKRRKKHRPPPLSINDDVIKKALNSPAIQQALNSPTLKQVFNSDIILSPPDQPQKGLSLEPQATTPTLVDTEIVQQALNSPTIQAALNSPTLKKALDLNSLQQALNLEALQQALKSPTIQQTPTCPATIQETLKSNVIQLSQTRAPPQSFNAFKSQLSIDSQLMPPPPPQNLPISSHSPKQLSSPKDNCYMSPTIEEQLSPVPMDICSPPMLSEIVTAQAKRTARKTFLTVANREHLSIGELRILAELKQKNRELRQRLRQALAINENGYVLLAAGIKLEDSDDET